MRKRKLFPVLIQESRARKDEIEREGAIGLTWPFDACLPELLLYTNFINNAVVPTLASPFSFHLYPICSLLSSLCSLHRVHHHTQHPFSSPLCPWRKPSKQPVPQESVLSTRHTPTVEGFIAFSHCYVALWLLRYCPLASPDLSYSCALALLRALSHC